MKTKLMFAVMSCLLLPLLCANLVFAQTDSITGLSAEQFPRFKENFSKAGQVLLRKYEDQLHAKALVVDHIF